MESNCSASDKVIIALILALIAKYGLDDLETVIEKVAARFHMTYRKAKKLVDQYA